MLLSAYYFRTYGTPRSDRIVLTIGIGVVLGFFIAVIISLIYESYTGHIPQGILFLVMFFGSYVASFIIGAYASKKLREEKSDSHAKIVLHSRL